MQKTVNIRLFSSLFLQFECVGNALGYGVWWNDKQQVVKPYQYDSVYVYVWNESENSSRKGLRYSYYVCFKKCLFAFHCNAFSFSIAVSSTHAGRNPLFMAFRTEPRFDHAQQ